MSIANRYGGPGGGVSGGSGGGAAYQPGDVIDVGFDVGGGYFSCAGFISASRTEAYVTLFTEKSLSGVSSVSIDTFTGAVRAIAGYLDSSSNDTNWLSGYTTSADIVAPNVISLLIKKNSTFGNSTNNTPIVFSPKRLTLTLS